MADRIASVGDLWSDIRRRRRGLSTAAKKLARI